MHLAEILLAEWICRVFSRRALAPVARRGLEAQPQVLEQRVQAFSSRPAGPGIGLRPGGPGGPGAGPRPLRTGFVAQGPVEVEDEATIEARRKFDERKNRAKPAAGGPGAGTGREKEVEVADFSSTEFRKREMVFSAKKEKIFLESRSPTHADHEAEILKDGRKNRSVHEAL